MINYHDASASRLMILFGSNCRSWFSSGSGALSKQAIETITEKLRLDQLYVLRLIGMKIGVMEFGRFLNSYLAQIQPPEETKSGRSKDKVENVNEIEMRRPKSRKTRKSKKKDK